MRKLFVLIMSLMITASSFASTVGHQPLKQIMDEMNFDLSQSASIAEREQVAAAYEKRILEAFSNMSDEEIAEYSKELFAQVPEKLKADLNLLLSTIDFDKLTKAEKLHLLEQAVNGQYQRGASWDGEFLGDLFSILVIIPAVLVLMFFAFTCGPSHNCNSNTRGDDV